MAVGNRDPRDVSTILRVLFFREVSFQFKKWTEPWTDFNIPRYLNEMKER
jgi:hypothetical protein